MCHPSTCAPSAPLAVEKESDIRFIRRMQRDIAERNRSAEEVAEQFLETVRPMHELFVVPSKVHHRRKP